MGIPAFTICSLTKWSNMISDTISMIFINKLFTTLTLPGPEKLGIKDGFSWEIT